MIEDMTHLEVIKRLSDELQQCLIDYNLRSNGCTDKKTLLALRLEQVVVLREMLRRQERHLRYMNGEKIEPEAHAIEAVIDGRGGLLY
jgi:hypothetical protein